MTVALKFIHDLALTENMPLAFCRSQIRQSRLESAEGQSGGRRETVEKIRSALEKSGVEFIDENGGAPACGYESAIKRRVSTAYLRFRRQTFLIEHNDER